MATKTLDEHLTWRYATKKMDPAKTVAPEKVDAIIEAVRMAPTSSGTQPFEVFVVTNSELRSKIAIAANGQAQITDDRIFWFLRHGTTTRPRELTRLSS